MMSPAAKSGRVFNIKMRPKVVSKFSTQGLNRIQTHGPAPMDFHISGNDSIWITELSIGTPPQPYKVLIDTGSDISWLNCQNCNGCAIDDNARGVHVKPYDPKASRTAEIVKEGRPFCNAKPNPNSPCNYTIPYLDGTILSGYYVKDILKYNRVTGDHQTQIGTTNFTFGCTMQQTSTTSMQLLDQGIDGLLGMGTSPVALLGQMNETGSARNVFSICMDKRTGGGIFAVGKVVNPKVEMTPLTFDTGTPLLDGLPIQSMAFGDDVIELNATPCAFLDTGSDVSTIPKAAQVAVANLIAKKLLVMPIPYLDYHCFSLPEKVLNETYFDTVLPAWTFKFSETASMSVAPRNYMLFNYEINRWCIASNQFEYNVFILGVPFFTEKLVVFDNESKSVGMIDYDCTSSIEVGDDSTGEAFHVDSHLPESHA